MAAQVRTDNPPYKILLPGSPLCSFRTCWGLVYSWSNPCTDDQVINRAVADTGDKLADTPIPGVYILLLVV